MEPRAVALLIDRYEAALPQGAWPNWVLGNHDRPRLASRLGSEQAPGPGAGRCVRNGLVGSTLFRRSEGLEASILRPFSP